MKRALAVLLLTLGLARGETIETMEAERHAITLSTNIVGGSLTWTNRAEFPWAWGSIGYVLPQNWTNTFTVKLLHAYDVYVQIPEDQVVTNVFGNIETNSFFVVTNTVESVSTQLVFKSVTTNALDHSYGIDGSKVDGEENSHKLIEGQYVLPGDRLLIEMTATNSTPLKIQGTH